MLIEHKCNRAMHYVVAQVLAEASRVEKLTAEDIATHYKRYRQDANLEVDFLIYFGLTLDEDPLSLNRMDG